MTGAGLWHGAAPPRGRGEPSDRPQTTRGRTTAPTLSRVTTDDYAKYIAALPRILAGAATLIRDGRGHVLLVQPNYRDGWALPGGTIESDQGETPRQAARRETLEEIGLDLSPGRLLAVDWVPGPDRPPIAAYVYDGGVLTEERLKAIRLQEEELLDWRLVPREEITAYLPGRLGHRVLAALDVLTAGAGAAELENGRTVG